MFSQRRFRPAAAWFGRRLVALFGSTSDSSRQTFVALGLNSATSFAAGIIVAKMSPVFDRNPAILILLPGAIGLRGNVFGAMGSRIATAIHTGDDISFRDTDGYLFRNITAALRLTFTLSVFGALAAAAVAAMSGRAGQPGVAGLVVVSTVGGLMASLVVLSATVMLALIATRRGWDLDNLVAPTVSTLGDVVTVPSLWLATTLLVLRPALLALFAVVLVGIGIASLWRGYLSPDALVGSVIRESVPLLSVAVLLSTVGGLAVAAQIDRFTTFPALLILIPAFVSSLGALGGIASARLATMLHLGATDYEPFPSPEVRIEFWAVAAVALPVMLFNAIGAHVLAGVTGSATPGLGAMVLVALGAAVPGLVVTSAVAYYGTGLAWRLEVDPDNVGIPMVTATADCAGSMAVVLMCLTLGLG